MEVFKDDTKAEQLNDAIDLLDFLKSKEGNPLWSNEDISIHHPNVPSAIELQNFLVRVTSVLSDCEHQDLREKWANEALMWAISCPVVHLISRSYQIYRQLNPHINREAVIDVLRALWKAIDGQSLGIALEILCTLQVMVEGLDSQRLVLFTRIFWSAVALLYTDFEQLYAEATKLLSKLVIKIDFSDRSVQNVLRASIPIWETKFTGIQLLVMKGLLSPITEVHSVKLLSQLIVLPCDDIFHPQSCRFVANLVSLLPHLCMRLNSHVGGSSLSNGTIINDVDCNAIAAILTQVCDSFGYSKLCKIFEKYSTYENSMSFLKDLSKPLKDVISPKHIMFTFTTIFHLLEHGPSFYHQVLLQVIYHLFSVCLDVCLENSLFRNKISEWLSMTNLFIRGPFWSEALQVLVVGMKQTEPSIQSTIRTLLSVPDPKEFSNSANSITSGALAKVLETCKYSEKGKYIHHGISSTFWNKFFSEDVLLAARSSETQPLVSVEDEKEEEDIEMQQKSLMCGMDRGIATYGEEDIDEESFEENELRDMPEASSSTRVNLSSNITKLSNVVPNSPSVVNVNSGSAAPMTSIGTASGGIAEYSISAATKSIPSTPTGTFPSRISTPNRLNSEGNIPVSSSNSNERLRLPINDFGRFPRFQGFEELLNFDEFEEQEEGSTEEDADS